MITSLRIGLVCLLYAAIGLGLYRARVFSDSAIFDSDLFVFGMPALIAFFAVLRLLTTVGFSYVVATLLACGLVVLSFLAYMSLAGNLYGT